MPLEIQSIDGNANVVIACCDNHYQILESSECNKCCKWFHEKDNCVAICANCVQRVNDQITRLKEQPDCQCGLNGEPLAIEIITADREVEQENLNA